jgi:hypothetical protein
MRPVAIGVFLVISVLLVNIFPNMVKASQPSVFFDPFTYSSPDNSQTQIGSQLESPKNDCGGQNCDSLYGSYLTEQLNQLLMSKANEICGAGESSECNQLII